MSDIQQRASRVYNNSLNVYDAANERLRFIFDNFERIYLSFSGGKDSGVMLNMTLDFMRKHCITKKIGVMILDNEANYEYSLRFMRSILNKNLDLLDVYWCCLPITLPCTVSSYAVEWQCWGERDKDRWIRPMPPSYRAICHAILSNDHSCKSLGFSPQRSAAYMEIKRAELRRSGGF